MISFGSLLVGASLSMFALIYFDRNTVEETPTNVDEVIQRYEREMNNGSRNHTDL